MNQTLLVIAIVALIGVATPGAFLRQFIVPGTNRRSRGAQLER